MNASRDSPTTSSAPSTNDHATTRLTTTITQGATQLKKALTLARGFERQKLGRRQKAANHEPHTLLKLREEVIVMKGLDLGVVAERQLLRRLGRVKRVVESEAWQGEYGARKIERVKGEAEGRVVGRLMGSAAVRECADGVVGRVMDVLGLEAVVGGGKEKEVKERAVKRQDVKFAPRRARELTRAEGDAWSGSEWSGSESAIEDNMDSADDLDIGNGIMPKHLPHHDPDASNVDMDSSSTFSGFSARIASPSAGSDASDANSQVSKEQSLIPGRSKPGNPPKADLNILASPHKLKPSKLAPLPPSSTAFLPSLMLGGYYSGSESGSDVEDIEDTHSKPRKNRRGQRERQKIAEAKFGPRAKHLAGKKVGRNEGWDARKGATAADRDRNGNGHGKFNGKGRMRIGRSADSSASANVNGSSKGPTGANGDMLGPSSRKEGVSVKDNAGAMHPSWEAARKRKEQGSKITIDTGRGGGVGKKITFD